MNALLEKLQLGVSTQTAEATEQLASEFAACLPVNSVLALHGDLGAGKTTFIRGMARAWNILEPVTSPSFNLYNVYQGDRQLIHLDAYRLEHGAELATLMIEDFLSPPWCLAVEWPERIADSLPDDIWHLYLEIDADRNHSFCLKLP
ncbi:MAG: tRNA threonylcarbamoyladenosine biosynthesis protein TsaE [Lentimonas sp.]|jgi:tRNA threonylcarbamoyladenosine biosynthesis protein TsaE